MQTKNLVGRPPVADKAKNRSMSLNDAEYEKFRQLGGIKWFKEIIYLEYLIKFFTEYKAEYKAPQFEKIKNDDGAI